MIFPIRFDSFRLCLQGGRRRLRVLTLGLSATLSLSLLSCSDLPKGITDLERLTGTSLERDGYRYFDEFISLTPQPGSYIVEVSDGLSAQALTARLSAAGLDVQNVVTVGQPSGHYQVDLRSDRVPSRETVFASLAMVSEVRFLSPVYRDPTGARVLPLNQAVVRFKPGTSAAKIAILLARHHLEVVSASGGALGTGDHRVRFTRVVEPYQRVNALWNEPIVDWAALDAINEGRRLM